MQIHGHNYHLYGRIAFCAIHCRINRNTKAVAAFELRDLRPPLVMVDFFTHFLFALI